MTAATPIQEIDRYQSLDMIRGVALFGILLMNITGFGLPFAYGDPTNFGGATGANLWAWITTNMLFEGTQRGMFSILFGAGFMVLIRRQEATNPGSIHRGRVLGLSRQIEGTVSSISRQRHQMDGVQRGEIKVLRHRNSASKETIRG